MPPARRSPSSSNRRRGRTPSEPLAAHQSLRCRPRRDHREGDGQDGRQGPQARLQVTHTDAAMPRPRQQEAPPAMVNGKTNPAYSKWKRTTPEGKASASKWNHSVAGKAARDKYNSSTAAKAAKRRLRLRKHEAGVITPVGCVQCAKCKMTFERYLALSQGFRTITRNKGLCADCDPNNLP